jgi:hypothetical protein
MRIARLGVAIVPGGDASVSQPDRSGAPTVFADNRSVLKDS